MNHSRKPNGRVTAPRARRALPIPAVRKQIWEAAQSLDPCDQLVSEVLAREFELPPSTIEAVLLREGRRYERTAAALRTGIVSALQAGREVGESEILAVA
jgi:predicted transcriptional regulator with HTH domain